MWGYDSVCWGLGCWWEIPVAIVVMILLCFIMMKRGMGRMMCGPFSQSAGESFRGGRSESARDILDKRYVRGEISKEEYEEKKSGIEQSIRD